MICAIHQPNFFPWLGYFDKIKNADRFIILDDVQYPKKGGGWSNRVSFNINGKSQFFTAPITRPHGLRNINEVDFTDTNWRIKFIKTLQANYAKAPYFNEYKDFIFELINFPSNNIAHFNINAIEKLCSLLAINTPMETSSSHSVKTTSNQLLIDLTKSVSCNTYMAGGGADGYQDTEMFKQQGIGFQYQSFKHPKYDQIKTTEFIAGLSIVDYIFNMGIVEW